MYLKLIQTACKYLVVNVQVCVRESMSVSKEFRLFSRLCHVATGNSLNAYCFNGERERVDVCESYITVCTKSLLMKRAFGDFIE